MSDQTPDEPVDVLLVEDNPGDVRLTREAFESIDSEIEFHVVTDGDEVTRYFQRRETDDPDPNPDLVLLDLNLPSVDGFTVLERLDGELDYPPPPVPVLSSSSSPGDIGRSYENTANAYLTKPDTIPEFNSMARAIESFWFETAQYPPVPS